MSQIRHTLNVLSALTASSVRGWQGLRDCAPGEPPAQLLVLYDIETSPYCRIVRETLTNLDIDVLIYPCPTNGQRFRPQAESLGGKPQFPLLHDPNTEQHMYESAEIVAYLHQQYGGQAKAKTTPNAIWSSLNIASSFAASALRAQPNGIPGLHAQPSRAPEQPLGLYSFESSPYSKAVRERLCELELPFITRQFGKHSNADMGPPWMRKQLFPERPITGRNRRQLHAMTGKMQVPYLIDPNTDVAMFESRDIIDYLNKTYAISN